jgi:outer membrane protein assembly factor BamD
MNCFFPLLCLCISLFLGSSHLVYAESIPNPSRYSQPYQSQQRESSTVSTGLKDLREELKDKSALEIFKKAERAFNKDSEWPTALKTYQILNSLYPFSEYAERARFKTVKAYHNNSEMGEVIRSANEFISLYPTSADIEEVYFLRTEAYFLLDRDTLLSGANKIWRYLFGSDGIDFSQRTNKLQLFEAAYQCSEFLKRFPQGAYREKVEKILDEIRQLIVRKEYNSAKRCFKYRYYVAAYNYIVALFAEYSRDDVRHILGEKDAAHLEKIYQASKAALGLV